MFSLPSQAPSATLSFSSRDQVILQQNSVMAVKTYTWISLWFLLTAPVIAWDVGYCFARPRSFKGGDLHWIWEPYSIYQNVDYIYGVEAHKRGDGFTNAQAFMNVLETLLNLTYLWLAHVKASPAAVVVGFSAVVMTLSKTMLYWLQEYFCNFCAVGHNTSKDLLIYYLIPNGLWIVVPAVITYVFGRDIARSLTLAAHSKGKKTN